MASQSADDVDLLVRQLQVILTKIRAQQEALEARIAEAVSLAARIADCRAALQEAPGVRDDRSVWKPGSP